MINTGLGFGIKPHDIPHHVLFSETAETHLVHGMK